MKRRDATVGLSSEGIAGYAMRTGKGKSIFRLDRVKDGDRNSHCARMLVGIKVMGIKICESIHYYS
jgi:hypothetical protein